MSKEQELHDQNETTLNSQPKESVKNFKVFLHDIWIIEELTSKENWIFLNKEKIQPVILIGFMSL